MATVRLVRARRTTDLEVKLGLPEFNVKKSTRVWFLCFLVVLAGDDVASGVIFVNIAGVRSVIHVGTGV